MPALSIIKWQPHAIFDNLIPIENQTSCTATVMNLNRETKMSKMDSRLCLSWPPTKVTSMMMWSGRDMQTSLQLNLVEHQSRWQNLTTLQISTSARNHVLKIHFRTEHFSTFPASALELFSNYYSTDSGTDKLLKGWQVGVEANPHRWSKTWELRQPTLFS